MLKNLLALGLMLITFSLSGCSHYPPQPRDPYQAFNRVMFAVNMDIDHLILRPAAAVYNKVTPTPVHKGLTNVFANLQMTTTIANDILQFKIHYFFVDLWRLIINSTVGVGGLFDVATRLGFPKHYEDFGLTLAYWDHGRPMPYLMLPVLGANTLRSALGIGIDYLTNPFAYVDPNYVKYIVYGVNTVVTRANFTDADKLLDQSFDPYVFLRNAYMQRRDRLIKENREPYKTIAQRRKIKTIGEEPPPPPEIQVLPGTSAIASEHQKEIDMMKKGQLKTKSLPKPKRAKRKR